MVNYIVSTKAYTKILLHATKHPASTVNGLLTSVSSPADDTITISDVIPLLHHWNTLTPMLEVGLHQAEIYAQKKDLQIVGYYQANEVDSDKTLTSTGARIAGKIKDIYGDAVVLVVNNTKLSLTKPEIAVLPYIYKENQWRPVNKSFEGPPSSFNLDDSNAINIAAKAITDGQSQKIYDFDEHLENVELDWLGNGLVSI